MIQKAAIGIAAIAFAFKISYRASKSLFIKRLMIMLAESLIPIGITVLFARMIDAVYLGIQQKDSSILFANTLHASSPFATAIVYLICYILLQIASIALGRIKYNAILKIKAEVNRYINGEISDKMMHEELEAFDRPDTYDTLSLILSGRQSIEKSTWQCFSMLQGLITVITSAVLLSALSPLMSLFVIGTCIPYFLNQLRFTRDQYNFAVANAKPIRRANYIQNVLTAKEHAQDVRQYQSFSETLLQQFHSIKQALFDEKKSVLKRNHLRNLVLSNVYLTSVIAAFVLSIRAVVRGFAEIGGVFYYTSLCETIAAHVKSVFQEYSEISQSIEVIERYRAFMNTKIANPEPDGTRDLPGAFTVEFVDVGFRYPNCSEWILRKFNLRFSSRDKIALVGLNGCGKSTLIKLLLRLYPVQEGQILLDRIPIGAYRRQSLNKAFGVMFQDYNLYHMSISENITLEDSTAQDADRLDAACAFSGIRELIASFPNGYAQQVSKEFDSDGAELSKGQQQRIALSRACYAGGSMLIFDEPSASIDIETEKKLFCMIAQLCVDKGLILVSHRLSNILIADRIVYIENGIVSEMGSHKELMALGGKYAELYRIQFELYETDGDTIPEGNQA